MILSAIIGVITGFAIGHFKSKSESSRLEERNINLDTQLSETEQRLHDLQLEKEQQLTKERDEKINLERELAGLKSEYRLLQEKLNEQKTELTEMQDQLKVQFENLANKILDEKSEKFTKQNKESLDQLLNPLGIKLEEFKKKVEETYNDENRQRATLKEQIKQMADLNQKMSEDAKNLTKALKGDNKAVGDWGEMILERILERSGLTKGREYETQKGFSKEDGMGHNKPDVVVYLPDEKYMIIDSKVSLKAYEQYTSSEPGKEQERFLKDHVNSLRSHVKGLSEKSYQNIHGDKSPDFVLLFIPIEPAFAAALQTDPNLYYEAFERNIVIVSPSTLLATLFTINTIWKRDRQNKNALQIAERGGALYDKFVGFVESMDDIGLRIRQTQDSFDTAMGRLSTGRGNLMGQVKKLEKLGVKATKKLPDTDSLED